MVNSDPLSIIWTRQLIRQSLIDVVTEIQSLGGSDLPEFSDELILLLEVHRFDSITGLEAILRLEEIFGAELPDDIMYDASNGRPAPLSEVVERIFEILNSK